MSFPASTFLRLAFHILGSVWMAYGYSSLRSLPIDATVTVQYGGHFQYLTVQGLAIACTTFLLASLLDVFPNWTIAKYLKSRFLLLSLPASAAISSIYWSLRIFFPTLILLKDEKTQTLIDIPFQTDVALHLVPGCVLVLDFFLLHEKLTRRQLFRTAPLVILAYAIIYSIWTEWCALQNQGKFPYPFLPENNFAGRIAIYCATSTGAYVSLWVLNSLHR